MAEPIRVVIVDDEPPARALLREFLASHPDVEIAAECSNGFEAVKRIGEVQPDLVFLDVQMPKLDGFEVLELLDPGPAVIFVTAHDEHALRAFDVHAVDYLLKPYGRERLSIALERFRARRGQVPPAGEGAVQAAPEQAAALAASARPDGRWLERVVVKDRGAVHVIPIERVDFVEAQDDYVAIHAAGKSYLKTQALGDLAAALDPARFVRIHRSYVVQVDRIVRLETIAKESRVAILADGREIPVSRSGWARLRELTG